MPLCALLIFYFVTLRKAVAIAVYYMYLLFAPTEYLSDIILAMHFAL